MSNLDPNTDERWWNLIQPDMCVLDVGANVGSYTIEAARRIGVSGLVHAIEPGPLAFQELLQNVHALPQVRCYCCAVGDKHEAKDVFHYRDWTLLDVNLDDSRYFQRDLHEAQPRRLKQEFFAYFYTLDEFKYVVASERRIDFVKIDVDGYENRVLRGAAKFVHSDRPILHIEVSIGVAARVGESLESSLALLSGWEYRKYGTDLAEISDSEITKLVENLSYTTDIVCVPEERCQQLV